ncbi:MULTISPECIES: hypothetical protein [Bacillus cereus group]|uniref:hypothetical protein n=1 Tax=Bacillus cereus group TaxID=86661 RepID=UPI0022E4028C|nr:hypothetical protein [Bacillus cereus group sp. TH152-1LC]MDA1675455.1 hypothetical protein [Bacillus cereus group sp. TH152-1LC]
MKKLMSIETIWSRQYDLSGEHQLFVPALCHTPYGKIEDRSSLFATPNPEKYQHGRGTLST